MVDETENRALTDQRMELIDDATGDFLTLLPDGRLIARGRVAQCSAIFVGGGSNGAAAESKADEQRFFEIEIRATDARGNTATTHGEFETAEADPQRAAHLISDAAIKKFGNAKYREIDDRH